MPVSRHHVIMARDARSQPAIKGMESSTTGVAVAEGGEEGTKRVRRGYEEGEALGEVRLWDVGWSGATHSTEHI